MLSDEALQNYVNGSFNNDSVWFGVENIDGDIVATCHVAVMGEGSAELGCSVDSECRGQGIAQLMFSRAVTWLRTKTIKTVFMHCLSENAVIRHIASKNHMTLVSQYGEVDAEVGIEPPTPMTFMEDAYLDRIALYDMVAKNSYRMFKSFMGVREYQ